MTNHKSTSKKQKGISHQEIRASTPNHPFIFFKHPISPKSKKNKKRRIMKSEKNKKADCFTAQPTQRAQQQPSSPPSAGQLSPRQTLGIRRWESCCRWKKDPRRFPERSTCRWPAGRRPWKPYREEAQQSCTKQESSSCPRQQRW